MTRAAPIVDAADAAGTFVVEVLLFAVHAERAGRAELPVRLRPGATVAELRDELRRQGHASLLGGQVRVAVNEALAGDAQPIHAGDEVALIPPVAGG